MQTVTMRYYLSRNALLPVEEKGEMRYYLSKGTFVDCLIMRV